MTATLALLTFSLAVQSRDAPWSAPKPPDLYPPESAGQARVGPDGVYLPRPLSDWLGGFVGAMRVYPDACQRTIDRARAVESEICESALADQARAASIATATSEGWTTLDMVIVGVAALVVGAAGGVIYGVTR